MSECFSASFFVLLIAKSHINGTRNTLSTAESASNVFRFVVLLVFLKLNSQRTALVLHLKVLLLLLIKTAIESLNVL